MKSKYAIVIDGQGNKVAFVLVEESEKDKPMYYTLKNNESLIYEDIHKALSMHKPRWNGQSWQETATSEEIAAAQPEPMEYQPSESEIIMLAVAELYEKYEKVLGGATT